MFRILIFMRSLINDDDIQYFMFNMSASETSFIFVYCKLFVSRAGGHLLQIVLYCIVLYCIVLYCIVLYCIVLYCIVLYCIVLYCIILYCIVLYCIVLYCIVLYFLMKFSSTFLKFNLLSAYDIT